MSDTTTNDATTQVTVDPAATVTDPKVTVYSTSWCAFCKTEKQYLESKGVAFSDKNIEEDEAAYNELMAKIGGDFKGVPVTDVAGEIILGFNRPAIDAAIAKI